MNKPAQTQAGEPLPRPNPGERKPGSIPGSLGCAPEWPTVAGIKDSATANAAKTEPPSSPLPKTAPGAGPIRIGREGQPLRALAFAGGGFDTAMHLGVAHALLVARCVPPDVVVGISGGAVNAAALAEVLKAGSGTSQDEELNLVAKVAKFREILEAYRNAPGELLAGILPDPFEVNARAPLETQELPIHFAGERAERKSAVNARFGVIRLLNALLSVRLKFSTGTQIVRAILEWRRLGECGWTRRWLGRAREGFRLWLLLGGKLFVLATPVWHISVGILFAERYQALVRRIESTKGQSRTGDRVLTWLLKGLLQMSGLYAEKSAKDIILQFGIGRRLSLSVGWMIGLIWTLALWLLAPMLGVIACILPRRCVDRPRGWAVKRFLDSYDLQKDLLTPYLIKPLFVRLFDPDYYGKMDFTGVLNRALGGEDKSAAQKESSPKELNSYIAQEPRIHVVPVAANVATGELEPLGRHHSVVDALLAAVAAVPLFRAQKLGDQFYVDGLNLSNEPTRALMEVLRNLDPKSGSEVQAWDAKLPIEVYPVSPFPVPGLRDGVTPPPPEDDNRSPEDAEPRPAKYPGLVEVAVRALKLQRLRDAAIERQLVEVYNEALPPESTFHTVGSDQGLPPRTFVRIRRHPIEPEQALNLDQQILQTEDRNQRRQLVAKAVAEGCRASLQCFLPRLFDSDSTCSCLRAMEKRLYSVVPGGLTTLPGSDKARGPGVAEVCRYCAWVGHGGRRNQRAPAVGSTGHGNGTADWPIIGAPYIPSLSPHCETRASAQLDEPSAPDENWPKTRAGREGSERPTVSLLFSGGVFRGVFQVGVVNALNEVGVQPDLIAGSSVGAIMSALVGEVFQTEPAKRGNQIAKLAATFLTIDRLILTDRLADFVRHFTLRAADARFSLYDADQFLRRYDVKRFGGLNQRSRRVIAGLERLFYLSPFQLRDLVKACRDRDMPSILKQLSSYLQTFLDRSGVGEEVLGTEPLALLIQEHVLRNHSECESSAAPFELFASQGIHFLATATNLTKGSLDILSSQPKSEDFRAALRNGLLASSAFPALFRPRLAWEIFRHANTEDQFIDGGVMDNLPIGEVIEFLNEAALKGRIAPQPKVNGAPVPHLLLTASLEVNRPDLDPAEVSGIAGNWPALLRRTRELKYNQKVERFAATQRDLRRIRAAFGAQGRNSLDLEVLVVKPEWLPGTFAFNPMLGFRRRTQAQSIAHGCAATLAELHQQAMAERSWPEGWGLKDSFDEGCLRAGAKAHRKETRLVPRKRGPGKCFFRTDAACPFSLDCVKKCGDFPDQARTHLNTIYKECENRATHAPH